MNTIKTQLSALIEEAGRQVGYHEHQRGDSPSVMTKKPAGVSGVIDLRELDAASPASLAVRSTRALNVKPAAETVGVAIRVAGESAVVRAGAHLIFCDPVGEAKPLAVGGQVAWQSRPGYFVNVRPADFAMLDGWVTPAEEVTDQPPPISREEIDLGRNEGVSSSPWAWSTTLTRRDSIMYENLQDEILLAIQLGVARLADQVLLRRLDRIAETLAPYSLAAFAAAGLRFGDAKAVIGSAATGAAVGVDGVLRAQGVAGDLTDTTAATYIGAWSRAAIAMRPELRVSLLRSGRDGALQMTIFVDAEALIPSSAFFFKVAA